nr:XRE family transcriptional regulator [Streptomyces sp.]
MIYTAAPGSPSEEALRLLSVVGTQRMDVTREFEAGFHHLDDSA